MEIGAGYSSVFFAKALADITTENKIDQKIIDQENMILNTKIEEQQKKPTLIFNSNQKTFPIQKTIIYLFSFYYKLLIIKSKNIHNLNTISSTISVHPFVAKSYLTALSTNKKLKIVSDEVAEKPAQEWEDYSTDSKDLHLKAKFKKSSSVSRPLSPITITFLTTSIFYIK